MADSYIFVHLMGGMGNQLFQYAAGMLQKKLTNGELYLCTPVSSVHENTDYRNILMNQGKNYDKEIPPHISLYQDSAFTSWNPHEYKYPILYMYGYFQNYNSLKPILDDFISNIKDQLIDQRKYMANKYKVAYGDGFIHVRRGDYVGNSYHHLQPLIYYSNALKVIRQKRIIKRWFIFSDDIPWCKSNELFNSLNPVWVEEKDAVLNLALMSEIKDAAIIANSSFSWMGAMLGVGLKQMSVVYPLLWYNNQTPDLPDSWIGI